MKEECRRLESGWTAYFVRYLLFHTSIYLLFVTLFVKVFRFLIFQKFLHLISLAIKEDV